MPRIDSRKMFAVNSTFHSHGTKIKIYKWHQHCHKLTLLINTVRIAGELLWNSLSDESTDNSTYFSFRNHYRRYLISHL